jgi:NADH-quinone oxidoreductase subunit A
VVGAFTGMRDQCQHFTKGRLVRHYGNSRTDCAPASRVGRRLPKNGGFFLNEGVSFHAASLRLMKRSLYSQVIRLQFTLAKRAPAFYLLPMETADSQLLQYIPVLLLAIVAVGFAAGTLFASVLLGKRGKDSRIKDTAYECGMLPVGDGSTRLSVKFYLVAMLFILFDIEVVFLYPWAVIYRAMLAHNAGLILGSMACFMFILFVGYLYALKKGAFDWKH